jgi:hypothetical protein
MPAIRQWRGSCLTYFPGHQAFLRCAPENDLYSYPKIILAVKLLSG